MSISIISEKEQHCNSIAPQRGALGTNTELPDTRHAESVNSKTDEELDKLGKVLRARHGKGLRDNFTLADVAHSVLRKYNANPAPFKRFVDGSKEISFKRNLFCGNILATHSAIKKTIEHESYVNTNIAYCSSVWLCPVCSSLIQSRRAEEIQQALDYADENDYKVIMITYTASHYANYALNDFGKRLQTAYSKMNDQLKRLRKEVEVGNIKAVEFTYSEKNGWHKHFHTIYILKKDCHVGKFYEKIQAAWELQCANYGLLDVTDEKALSDFRKHSTSLSVGSKAVLAKYVSKQGVNWTIADEMTKSVLKIGHDDEHMTPFQILANIAMTHDRTLRYKLIDVFIEYAIHTKCAHQLDWSNGLKAKVGVLEKSDEELLDEKKDTAVYVAALTVAHWHLLRSKYLRIKYFKALKSASDIEEAYAILVQFFKDEADDSLANSILSASDAELLETYDEREYLSEEESERLFLLQDLLQTIASCAEYQKFYGET